MALSLFINMMRKIHYLVANLNLIVTFVSKILRMIIIADSGSTKTDWALVDDGQVIGRIRTQGINPFHESEDTIFKVLMEEFLPKLGNMEHIPAGDSLDDIFFYGSGCTPEMAKILKTPLRKIFPDVADIKVNGDLLAAARAVCGHSVGIACILGTGANSCLYDGENIVANTPPLGYILGDEGSGAVLGQLFLNSLFKGFLPEWMKDDFLKNYSLTYPDIIRKVYREPLTNRFLASIANYIAKHIDMPVLKDMVTNNFRRFFDRNLSQYAEGVERYHNKYGITTKPKVGFVGGIAFQFSSLLITVAQEKGYDVTIIEKSPIDGLIRYHK